MLQDKLLSRVRPLLSLLRVTDVTVSIDAAHFFQLYCVAALFFSPLSIDACHLSANMQTTAATTALVLLDWQHHNNNSCAHNINKKAHLHTLTCIPKPHFNQTTTKNYLNRNASPL